MNVPTKILDKSLKKSVLIAGVFKVQGGNISYQESDEVPSVDQAVLKYFLSTTPTRVAELIKSQQVVETVIFRPQFERAKDALGACCSYTLDDYNQDLQSGAANLPTMVKSIQSEMSKLPEFAWQGDQRGDDYRLIFHRKGQQPSQPKGKWIKLLNWGKWANVEDLIHRLEQTCTPGTTPTELALSATHQRVRTLLPPNDVESDVRTLLLYDPPKQAMSATSATHQTVPTVLSNDPPNPPNSPPEQTTSATDQTMSATSATQPTVPTPLPNDPRKQAMSATVPQNKRSPQPSPRTSDVRKRPPEQATSESHQTVPRTKGVRNPPNSPHITAKSAMEPDVRTLLPSITPPKQAAEPKPWYRSLLSACLGGQSKPRTRRTGRNGRKNGRPSDDEALLLKD